MTATRGTGAVNGKTPSGARPLALPTPRRLLSEGDQAMPLLRSRCTGIPPNPGPLARRGSSRSGDGTEEETRAVRTGVKNKRSRQWPVVCADMPGA
jgi:hypothetical protein